MFHYVTCHHHVPLLCGTDVYTSNFLLYNYAGVYSDKAQDIRTKNCRYIYTRRHCKVARDESMQKFVACPPPYLVVPSCFGMVSSPHHSYILDFYPCLTHFSQPCISVVNDSD